MFTKLLRKVWPSKISRRQFLRQTTVAALATCLPPPAFAARPAKLRAAIIGHTGQGNYGHELDALFNDRPNTELVAVADAHETGREKARRRTKAQRVYADYREMLEREKPELVCVAPRWTDEHFAMAQAALEAGAHLFIEKPFTQTLAEADALLVLAKQRGLRIAVAHQMRSAPNVVHLKGELDRGLIGELLEIRTHGKQDQRAGGEDLLVLGTHLFDLMRFFAGEPLWCNARVRAGDREVTRADARTATEGIGPVMGDAIFAQFALLHGVNATFQSRAANREIAGPWGVELIGSKGGARINTNIWPEILIREHGKAASAKDAWLPLEGDPVLQLRPEDKTVAKANARLVDDWLAAIAEDREPVCSGFDGMKALEMAHAVFESGLQRTRIALPLAKRAHPLATSEC